ncbi:hypothetical protein C8J55DRAFT_562490 [Lentinula edodes]|uniref:Uncharacterized protein n=1 Tax=Lentinula lateritia TaxID=40482 RepID=A0A9W9A4Y6_9AGAR|nr:hypothetical protein C8J55DRAFT_562490 [Lentinula edodes]
MQTPEVADSAILQTVGHWMLDPPPPAPPNVNYSPHKARKKKPVFLTSSLLPSSDCVVQTVLHLPPSQTPFLNPPSPPSPTHHDPPRPTPENRNRDSSLEFNSPSSSPTFMPVHLQNLYFWLRVRKQLGALPSSESAQSILLSVLSALGSAGICSRTLAEYPGFADDPSSLL